VDGRSVEARQRASPSTSRPSAERLRLTYLLTCQAGEDPHAKARDIAHEQTVELPAACLSPEIAERIPGEVTALEASTESRWRAVLSYDVVTVGEDLPQLLNLLFGNISLKRGILLTEIEWPPSLLAYLQGPRFGIEGLRALCGRPEGRPLLCTAAKPLGLSATELAHRCSQFALAGLDIIKDDHGLANQATAPFAERVARCQEAVATANARTGGNSLYFPNLTAPAPELAERAELARAAGCRGALLSPLLVGLDSMRWVAATSGLAILAHPSLAGAFFHETHGIAPELLLGDLFRVAGSDGVIYPNVGGRFPFPESACIAINSRLRQRLGNVRPAFPVPGGGIDVAQLPYWIDRYGPDTMFLIGGSLYAQADLVQAAARFREAVERG
jgi:ribulose-bisphosphate carboxylase large chain